MNLHIEYLWESGMKMKKLVLKSGSVDDSSLEHILSSN